MIELVAADAGQLEHGGGRGHGDAVGSRGHGVEKGDFGLSLLDLLFDSFALFFFGDELLQCFFVGARQSEDGRVDHELAQLVFRPNEILANLPVFLVAFDHRQFLGHVKRQHKTTFWAASTTFFHFWNKVFSFLKIAFFNASRKPSREVRLYFQEGP